MGEGEGSVFLFYFRFFIFLKKEGFDVLPRIRISLFFFSFFFLMTGEEKKEGNPIMVCFNWQRKSCFLSFFFEDFRGDGGDSFLRG